MNSEQTINSTIKFKWQDASLNPIVGMAEHLVGLSKEDLTRTLLLTPTQRTATWLKAKICSDTNSTFFGDSVLPLEQFLRSPLQSISNTSPKDPISRDVISGLLDLYLTRMDDVPEEDLKRLLSSRHRNELEQVRNEFTQNQKHPTRLNTLYDEADMWPEDESAFALTKKMLTEMEQVYQDIYSTLNQNNLYDTTHLEHEFWVSQNAAPFLKSFDQIYIIGVTSISPHIGQLIKLISAHTPVQIVLPEVPLLQTRDNPIQSLASALSGKEKDFFKPVGNKNGSSKIYTTKCSSVFEECETVLGLVSKDIQSGCAAHEIAVLLPDEGSYRVPLTMSLESQEFEYNLAVPQKIIDTDFGRILKHLASLKLSSDSGLALQLFCEPKLYFLLKASGFKHEADDWLAQCFRLFHLVKLASKPNTNLYDLKQFALAEPEDLSCIPDAIDIIQSLQKSLWPENPASLKVAKNHFLSWNHSKELWENLIPSELHDSFEEVCETFFSLCEHLELYETSEFKPHKWPLFFQDHFLSLSLRQRGEPLSGVQILSMAEARAFPFRHVYILGATTTNLPRSLPADELLDDAQKRALGLEGWKAFEAREELNIELLRLRCNKLTLSYPLKSASEAFRPSRFLAHYDALQLTQSLDSLVHGINDDPTDIDVPSSESIKHATKAKTPPQEWWNKNPKLSATRLHNFLLCPMRYALEVNRASQSINWLKDTGNDPAKEGEILHKILNLFLSNLASNPLDEDSLFSIGLRDLVNLTQTFFPSGKDSAIREHLTLYAWPKFLEFAKPFITKGEANSVEDGLFEFRFDLNLESSFNFPFDVESPIKASGSIDALLINDEWSVLIDFKRQRVPTRKEIDLGLYPQLAFYHHALARSSNESLTEYPHALLGYWSILKGSWQAASYDAQSDGSTPSAIQNLIPKRSAKPVAEHVDAMLGLWDKRHETSLELKDLYADPTHCGVCNLEGICRKNDPRYESKINAQKFLKKWM